MSGKGGNFLLWALCLLFALLLGLSRLGAGINPHEIWLFTYVELAFLPLFLVNVFLFFLAIIAWSRAAFLSLLALLLCSPVLGRYVQFRDGEAKESHGGETITVVTYNVGNFVMQGETLTESQCRDSIISALSAINPDIICLQECGIIENLEPHLRKAFPLYSIHYKNGYGDLICSRWEPVAKGEVKFSGWTSNCAIYCDYAIGGKLFRLYNCHLESHSISLEALAELGASDYSSTLRRSAKKMRFAILRRPRQVDSILAEIEESSLEAIIVGDFNDGPMSYAYSSFIKGRKDSFVEAGTGLGATYSKLKPLLRIDHILHPKSFKALSHGVIPLPFSDHYPVVATLEIKQGYE